MGLNAAKLNLRLFIDGVEVPVISADVQYIDGSGATATVNLVASDQVHCLTPRALIQLFVRDTYDFDLKPGTGNNPTPLGPEDPRRYKLLFQGEFATLQFTKGANQRHAQLTCVDPLNYLDYVKQHFFNFRNGGVETFENAFLGVNLRKQKFFDVTTKGVSSNLYVWLSKSKFNGKASLYLGVQRVLREMFFAANDFYAKAFNRHRLGDIIVGVPGDSTSARLFQLQFFEKFIKNQLGGQGGTVSARQLVNMLLGMVFHTHVTIPFPMFDETGVAKGFSPDSTNNVSDADLAELILKRDTFPDASLNYIIVKPDTWFLAPPACNVVFPHQYTDLTFVRQYLAEPTRLFLRSDLIFTGRSKWLTERFYAPDFDVLEDLLKNSGSMTERAAKILLPHEKFVGINPAEQWESELSVFVQKGARREYLSFVADYMFWRQRFATRQLSVNMPLNMNLIAGYPALIMERTGRPGEISRHFLGNIQLLRHVISQSGGMTSIQLAGARVHDETADFDEEGRTLEEVVGRGTDGWLDDRYDLENIGTQVYEPLFGIRSLVDQIPFDADLAIKDANGVFDLDPGATYADIAEKKGKLFASIAILQDIYRRAGLDGGDVQRFTDAFTQRPKASLVDLNGLGAGDAPESVSTTAFLRSQGVPEEGFMSTAVDASASDHANDGYTTVTRKRVKKGTRTVEKKTFTAVRTTGYQDTLEGDARTEEVFIVLEGVEQVEEAVYETQVTENKTSFNLAADINERQAAVHKYLKSIETRGIRG